MSLSAMSSVSSSSKHVLVTTTAAQPPQAIAIVLGHLGADLAELKRLSKLYADRNCSVVAARSPPLSFFLAQHRRLAPVTTAVRAETESLLREVPANTPVVVHSWSNGGAFLWEELLRDPDWGGTVGHRVRGVVYDSCPCYLHMPWRLGPYWGDAFPFPGWSPLGRRAWLLAGSLGLSLWCLLTGSLQRSSNFWTSMRSPSCRDLVYLYSTDDKVTDASRIDELVEEQRASGKKVTVLRSDTAAHCQLQRVHPQEYARAIDELLDRARGQ